MRDLKVSFLCAGVNFKKSFVSPRIYVVMVIMIIFEYYTFGYMPKIAAFYDVNSTPWVFPFLLGNPSMFIIFGSLTTLFYCNAPFTDRHMPFLIARTGRKNWIIGQLLYIYLSSFLYTAFAFIISIIMLLPRVEFSTEWGMLLKTLSQSPMEVMEQTGTKLSFMPTEEILSILSPIQATIISYVMFWFVSAFIGTLICCFNTVIGSGSGIIVSGIFTSISYFVIYLGYISIGAWLYYISPISWSSISYLDWNYTGRTPSPRYAIIALLLSIIIMSIITVFWFCKNDIEISKGDF